MVRIGLKISEATIQDYIEIQGGMPSVSKKDKLIIVEHDYPEGDGMIVTSHIDHGTVILNTSRGNREFQIDLLRQFHGEPCESESKKLGGEGYQRKK